MPVNFSYRFLRGAPHTTLWEVSLVIETEDHTHTLAADFRHSLVAIDDNEVLWTLKELGRRGPDIPLPPYLRSGKNRLPLSRKGVPGPGYALPCFLLPAFPDDELQTGTEWTVKDSSSGIALEHTFTVLEGERPESLRVVGDAVHENDEFEVELGGDYTFDAKLGVLKSAKIAIDTYRREVTRNLAIKIRPG